VLLAWLLSVPLFVASTAVHEYGHALADGQAARLDLDWRFGEDDVDWIPVNASGAAYAPADRDPSVQVFLLDNLVYSASFSAARASPEGRLGLYRPPLAEGEYLGHFESGYAVKSLPRHVEGAPVFVMVFVLLAAATMFAFRRSAPRGGALLAASLAVATTTHHFPAVGISRAVAQGLLSFQVGLVVFSVLAGLAFSSGLAAALLARRDGGEGPARSPPGSASGGPDRIQQASRPQEGPPRRRP